MRVALILSVMLLGFGSAMPVLGAPGDVEHSFAAPCKYPSGLASDGQNLYLLDWREAALFHIDGTDGRVLDRQSTPTLHPSGITCRNGHLYISDNRSGRVLVLDPDTGIVVNSFEAADKRPSGLAFIDQALYIVEQRSRKMYKVIPDDGTILDYYDLPSRNCAHVCYDGSYLWLSDRVADEIYMIRPADGKVIAILPAPDAYAAGIAWHEGKLWNVDFQSRQVYRVKTDDQPAYLKLEPKSVRCEYDYTLYNYGPGAVRSVEVNLALPVDLPGQQLQGALVFQTLPASLDFQAGNVVDQWGNGVRRFRVATVPAGQRLSIRYGVDVDLATVRYVIRPERAGTLDDIPADIRAKYTVDGPRYRISSEFIRQTVKDVVGDEKNPYWIARRIFDHLIDKLEYQMIGGWDVPEVVLRRGSGSCSEYTFAFIALCRAAGLPARYQGAVSLRGDDASIDEAFHRWAQIYLPNYGWVPVDANKGDRRSPADQARGFGEVSNRYLITTQGGGDSEYLRWGYNIYSHYQMEGYCHVEEAQVGFWEPRQAARDQRTPTQTGQANPATCQPR